MKWILFCGYVVGYVVGVAGPVFLDPLIATHVRYGARAYPWAPLTLLILAALLFSELIVLRRTRRTVDLYWGLVPYSVACVLTLPIFRPEFPHGNVSFVCLSTMLLSASTIVVKGTLEKLCLGPAFLQSNDGNQSDYLKEALSV